MTVLIRRLTSVSRVGLEMLKSPGGSEALSLPGATLENIRRSDGIVII